MPLTLSTRVCFGDRGGEDLFLVMESDDVVRTENTFDEDTWRCLQLKNTKDTGPDIRIENERLLSNKTDYGFKVDLSMSDVRELARKFFLSGYSMEEVYIDGNAD